MSKWNVFTKRHEMKLAINLHVLASIRDERRSIIIVSILHIDCSEEQVCLCRRRKIHNEAVSLFIFEQRARHRALRPNQQIGRRFDLQRDHAQSRESIKNLGSELRIELLLLW